MESSTTVVRCLDTIPVHGSLLSRRIYEVKLLENVDVHSGTRSYDLILSPVGTTEFIRVELAATTVVEPTLAEIDTGVDFRQRYHLRLRTRHGGSLVLNLITQPRFSTWRTEVSTCIATLIITRGLAVSPTTGCVMASRVQDAVHRCRGVLVAPGHPLLALAHAVLATKAVARSLLARLAASPRLVSRAEVTGVLRGVAASAALGAALAGDGELRTLQRLEPCLFTDDEILEQGEAAGREQVLGQGQGQGQGQEQVAGGSGAARDLEARVREVFDTSPGPGLSPGPDPDPATSPVVAPRLRALTLPMLSLRTARPAAQLSSAAAAAGRFLSVAVDQAVLAVIGQPSPSRAADRLLHVKPRGPGLAGGAGAGSAEECKEDGDDDVASSGPASPPQSPRSDPSDPAPGPPLYLGGSDDGGSDDGDGDDAEGWGTGGDDGDTWFGLSSRDNRLPTSAIPPATARCFRSPRTVRGGFWGSLDDVGDGERPRVARTSTAVAMHRPAKVSKRRNDAQLLVYVVLSLLALLCAGLVSRAVAPSRRCAAVAPVYAYLTAGTVIALLPRPDGVLQLRAWIAPSPSTPLRCPKPDCRACACDPKECVGAAWATTKQRIKMLMISGSRKGWAIARDMLSHAPEDYGGSTAAIFL